MTAARFQATPGLVEVCRRWRIARLEIFGSALRADFGPASDIDLLVTFERDARLSWEQEDQLRQELERVLGRRVDLLPRSVIERSRNPFRRRSILGGAATLYAA